MRRENGITLVALIITIIVMTILAGVVIVTAVMDGGILDRAQTAMRENERAEVEDIVMTSYVYKTTASMDIIGQLDLEETAKAIYSNLTGSDYKMKTLAGTEAQSYEEIYTQGASSINLKVEGKSGTYEGTVEKNGLRDGMKIVEDTGNEVPPSDDGNNDVVTNYSKTLNTNMNDYAEALAVTGMDIYTPEKKITYVSGSSKIIVRLGQGNSFDTFSVIYVRYTDAQGNSSIYAICNPENPWTIDEHKKYATIYAYVPDGYWTKPTGETYTSNINGSEADIYGFITELPIFESDQEWQIDSANTTQEGLNLLSNVLKIADGTETLPEPPKVEEKKLTLSTNADQIFTSEFKNLFSGAASSTPQNIAKLAYKSNGDELRIVSDCNDSMGSTNLVIVNYYKDGNLNNSYILRCTGGYYFDDEGNSENCQWYPHYSTGWTDKTIIKGTCTVCNGNIYGILSETQFPEFSGNWEIDEENSNDYGKQYLTNVLVEK